jgi:hypothetical protein
VWSSLSLDRPALESTVKKPSLLLLLAALAACGGDSTGSRPSLAGQWIFRMRASPAGLDYIGCQVAGTVRLAGSGSSFSGRMPLPEATCGEAPVVTASFDSTTTLTARVEGDSVLLTVRAGAYEFHRTARLLGDSLAVTPAADGSGMGARRYPDDVPLDRATVHLTGAVTRDVQLYGRGAWNGFQLLNVAKDEGVIMLAPSAQSPLLAVGSYPVGTPDAPLFGTYQRFVGGMVDPYVRFTGGTVTITSADAQLVSGTLDVTGVLNEGTSQVRLQGEFTSHRSGYPAGG